MNHFTLKNQIVLSTLAALALSAGSAIAAESNTITVVPDMGVAARTNMTRTASDTSTLGVSFDADVAKRTNMQRSASDVVGKTVKVTQDRAVMERTNMGDIARTKPAEQKEYAAPPSQ